MITIDEELHSFAREKDFLSRTGAICVGLHVSDVAKSLEFPIDPETLKSGKGSQVSGLSGGRIKKLLKRHGEDRLFSREGGRTNRGSVDDMLLYVEFLNKLHFSGSLDLNEAEAYWAKQASTFLDRDPFKLRTDSSWSTQAIVSDLLQQAYKRQSSIGGATHFAGALIQHLVGAKLDSVLGVGKIVHHSFTTSDDQRGRPGDFQVLTTSFHVSTSPSPSLIERCKINLQDNYAPVIVSTSEGVKFAIELARRENIADRIEFIEIEQFIATNVLEKSRFDPSIRSTELLNIVKRYNEIIDLAETQPSLRIEYL